MIDALTVLSDSRILFEYTKKIVILMKFYGRKKELRYP